MARSARSNPNSAPSAAVPAPEPHPESSSPDSSSKPKRIRRKCSAPNCENRVVQGGVCVTHGAKRKLCAHDGCDKAVKLAGFCSTHGPARRKCDFTGGCNRVAVQGGKCLSHGARRRVCSYPLSSKGGEKCSKNAIMGGMCKKHYDRVREAEGMLEMSLCVPVVSSSSAAAATASSTSGGASSVGGSAYGCGSGMSGVESEGESVLSSTPSWGSGGAAVARTTSAMEGWRGVSSHQQASVAVASYNHGAISLQPISCSNDGATVVRRASKKLKPSHSQPMLSTPSNWGFATTSMLPASASFEEAVLFPLAQQPSQGSVTVMSSTNGHHRQRAPKKPNHKRGLSIFDEMLTVDAIISSGAENQSEQQQAQQPPQQDQAPSYTQEQVKVSPLVAPPPSFAPPPTTNVSKFKYNPPQCSNNNNMSTRTPTTQVSFADCAPSRNKHLSTIGLPLTASATAGAAAPSTLSLPEETCTGNSSCACNACRSPTLAIFEQMIQASQKLERGEFDPAKYAGLSPPKLSPRKSSSAVRDGFAAGCRGGGVETPVMATTSTKNVSFLPEEPSSSGSVVRKVSSNNIVGEGCGWDANAAAAASQQAPSFPRDQARQDYHQGHAPQEGQAAPRAEGPASHALAAIAGTDADGVSRTVSHDVDDGHRYHPPGYYPHRSHGHAPHGPPPPHVYPAHYSHRGHPAHYAQHPQGAPQYPHNGYPPHGPPPPHPSYHHNNFQPPQTPALYDIAASSEQQQPLSVVSSHSQTTHHEQHQHLLPKRREAIEHLFIPKEV
mmetsp:Transcript_30494/g.64567  ORF Transcript_30494/g.64567 Transcript_30494/m.64567 type:complete len:779 (-) Transcript_30494:364-2700(-)|eukprot:CAMPEP_0172298474 /NCGR_PEP_ID=MMETSP1058-20130122/1115_1 /TAXON_ID=83371 /ORGANISM="Detonula confervacea, Strain CCMP 353" /LENGTH=778 /DNA_ID=CAMNT_0013007749 /DNA_START=73 /DNA_END=2409 /DNA_ORIENTATION=-